MLETRITTEEANRLYLDVMTRIENDLIEVHALMQSELRPVYELTEGFSVHLAKAHSLLHNMADELKPIRDDLQKRRKKSA